MKTTLHSWKKAIIAFYVVAGILLAAAGCGSQNGNREVAPPSTEPDSTAITAVTDVDRQEPMPAKPAVKGVSVGDTFKSLPDAELEAYLTDLQSLGVTWLRVDIAWDLIQPENPSQYEWAQFDRVVMAAARHNIKLLAVLAYSPEWARDPSCKDNFICSPADPATFANFAKEAVKHFAPLGIKSWEIWNEPNSESFWLPSPNAATYVRLLAATYPAIKQVDPTATVITGGLSPAENTPGRIAPRDFLTGMYQSGARNFFDALGYHPFSYPALPHDVVSWSCWSQMSDLYPSIRTIMIDNNDGDKKIWATEYGVPTAGQSDVNETLQALSFQDAIQQMGNMPWLTAIFFHTYKDDPGNIEAPTSNFGIVRRDGTRKPAYNILKEILATG